MTDHEPKPVPEHCDCGFPREKTPWHCVCGRWKPARAQLCEVCHTADAIIDSWFDRVDCEQVAINA